MADLPTRAEDFDADPRSVQEARRLAVACRGAQRQFATATQAEVDRICQAMADAVYRDAERLGAMAHEETDDRGRPGRRRAPR